MESTEYRKPGVDGVFIPGKQGRLFSTIYTPAGEAPFPVVILCHGFPGNERLLSFADLLREKGFCTVHFHYSGSWGSDGDFSFEHCMEDLDSVIDYVCRDESGLFDRSRIFVLGHSMGGLMACSAVASRPEITAASIIMPGNIGAYISAANESPEDSALIKGLFEGCGEWLHGYSWETDEANFLQFPGRYHLETYAEALSKIPVLFVAGTEDAAPFGEADIYPLLRAVRVFHTNQETLVEFDTDHSMNRGKPAIVDAVADFFSAV